jgi:Flp pilus assembly pilin Flp
MDPMAHACPVCGFPELTEPPRAPRSVAAERSGERGQAMVEYGGVLVIVALIIAALAVSGLPGTIAGTISRSVASALGGTAARASAPTTSGGGTGPAGAPGGAAQPRPGANGGGAGPGGNGTPGVGTGAHGSAATGALAADVTSAAANGKGLVDGGGDGWGNPAELARHFHDHGGDFGAKTPPEYARQAQDLLQRAVEQHLPTKVNPADGSIRVWDPSTDEFGAYNSDGTTKTYFDSGKNSNGNRPAGRAQRYWDKQPGDDPWSPPADEGGSRGKPGGGDENGGGGGEAGGGKAGGGEPEPAPPDIPEIPEIPEIPIVP